jgi:hypothetical protein
MSEREKNAQPSVHSSESAPSSSAPEPSLPIVVHKGVVLATEVTTSTVIEGTGPSGSLYGGYGTISGGRISSQSVDTRRVAIELETGKEVNASFNANHLMLREGQEVTVVSTEPVHPDATNKIIKNGSRIAAIMNKNGDYVFFKNAMNDLAPKWKSKTVFIIIAILFFISTLPDLIRQADDIGELIYGLVFASIVPALIVGGFIYLIISFFKNNSSKKKTEKAFAQELEKYL